MNVISAALADSATKVRRNLRHTIRNPLALFEAILVPIFVVYVLGGAFSVGTDYIDHATPGLIIMSIGYGIGPPRPQ
jgi:ABC-2 type transport system permease protein